MSRAPGPLHTCSLSESARENEFLPSILSPEQNHVLPVSDKIKLKAKGNLDVTGSQPLAGTRGPRGPALCWSLLPNTIVGAETTDRRGRPAHVDSLGPGVHGAFLD